MAMVNENIVIRLAQDVDIPEVKQLLERYHAKNLAGEQRANGFVTTDMTQQQLSELSSAESGVVIAVDRSCNKVIGLLLGGSWEFLSPWPMFKYMASILNEYRYQGKNWMRLAHISMAPSASEKSIVVRAWASCCLRISARCSPRVIPSSLLSSMY
ncbi:hypothetical protein LRM35_15260 [Klebsiella variicola subsp. variicola]|jgi:hypothetical protein|nr:hypothetical protein LRM35_15260 [Klebsiella variicola subsp. variicola]